MKKTPPKVDKKSPEWRQAQAEALRKMKAVVSSCHPYKPAIELRGGVLVCGELNCRKPVSREKIPSLPEKIISHGRERMDQLAANGYVREIDDYIPGEDIGQ